MVFQIFARAIAVVRALRGYQKKSGNFPNFARTSEKIKTISDYYYYFGLFRTTGSNNLKFPIISDRPTLGLAGISVVLMSGRPGLLLWQSRDGVNWQIALNIAKAHNEAVDRELRFQQAFVEAEVQGLTEVGSTAYTSLLLRGINKSTAVVVCYDRLAHGWYGNSNATSINSNAGVNLSGTDLIFCARLQNFTAIEDSVV